MRSSSVPCELADRRPVGEQGTALADVLRVQAATSLVQRSAARRAGLLRPPRARNEVEVIPLARLLPLREQSLRRHGRQVRAGCA